MPGLCMNPYATSLALYLTTSLFSFRFQTKTHLNPTGKTLGGVGIADVNTFLLVSEAISAWIASFHWVQSERFLQSTMILGSGSFRKISAIVAEKYMLTTVVLQSYDSPESM